MQSDQCPAADAVKEAFTGALPAAAVAAGRALEVAVRSFQPKEDYVPALRCRTPLLRYSAGRE